MLISNQYQSWVWMRLKWNEVCSVSLPFSENHMLSISSLQCGRWLKRFWRKSILDFLPSGQKTAGSTLRCIRLTARACHSDGVARTSWNRYLEVQRNWFEQFAKRSHWQKAAVSKITGSRCHIYKICPQTSIYNTKRKNNRKASGEGNS